MPKRKKRTVGKKRKDEGDGDEDMGFESSKKVAAASSTSHCEDDGDEISSFTSVPLVRTSIDGMKSSLTSHFMCNYCEFSAESKTELISHMRKHMIKCSKCQFSSLSRKEVTQHCKEEHDVELVPTEHEVATSSIEVEMDKDPCSACVFCKFMTYSTEHLERHTSLKHPGMLPKSVAKMVTKLASTKIRQGDVHFYLSISGKNNSGLEDSKLDSSSASRVESSEPIEIEDEKLVDVKPAIETVEQKVSTEIITQQKRLKEERENSVSGITPESFTQQLAKRMKVEAGSVRTEADTSESERKSERGVKVETIYCLTCPYSSALIDKLKCHTLVQHPLGAAAATYSSTSDSSLNELTFFCVKEECPYSTSDLKEYQNHLMQCSSSVKTLKIIEKERLKSTVSFIFELHKKHALVAEKEFCEFASLTCPQSQQLDNITSSEDPKKLMPQKLNNTHVSTSSRGSLVSDAYEVIKPTGHPVEDQTNPISEALSSQHQFLSSENTTPSFEAVESGEKTSVETKESQAVPTALYQVNRNPNAAISVQQAWPTMTDRVVPISNSNILTENQEGTSSETHAMISSNQFSYSAMHNNRALNMHPTGSHPSAVNSSHEQQQQQSLGPMISQSSDHYFMSQSHNANPESQTSNLPNFLGTSNSGAGFERDPKRLPNNGPVTVPPPNFTAAVGHKPLQNSSYDLSTYQQPIRGRKRTIHGQPVFRPRNVSPAPVQFQQQEMSLQNHPRLPVPVMHQRSTRGRGRPPRGPGVFACDRGDNTDDDVIVTAVVRSPSNQRGRLPVQTRPAVVTARGRGSYRTSQAMGGPSPTRGQLRGYQRGRGAILGPSFPSSPQGRQIDMRKHFEDLACAVNANEDEDDIQIVGMTPAKDGFLGHPKAVDASRFSYCCLHCGKDQGSKNIMKQHMKACHNDTLLGAFTNIDNGQWLYFCPQLSCEFMTYNEQRLSDHLQKCCDPEKWKAFDFGVAMNNLKSMKIRQMDVRSINGSHIDPAELGERQGMRDRFSTSLNDAFDDIVVNTTGRQVIRPPRVRPVQTPSNQWIQPHRIPITNQPVSQRVRGRGVVNRPQQAMMRPPRNYNYAGRPPFPRQTSMHRGSLPFQGPMSRNPRLMTPRIATGGYHANQLTRPRMPHPHTIEKPPPTTHQNPILIDVDPDSPQEPPVSQSNDANNDTSLVRIQPKQNNSASQILSTESIGTLQALPADNDENLTSQMQDPAQATEFLNAAIGDLNNDIVTKPNSICTENSYVENTNDLSVCPTAHEYREINQAEQNQSELLDHIDSEQGKEPSIPEVMSNSEVAGEAPALTSSPNSSEINTSSSLGTTDLSSNSKVITDSHSSLQSLIPGNMVNFYSSEESIFQIPDTFTAEVTNPAKDFVSHEEQGSTQAEPSALSSQVLESDEHRVASDANSAPSLASRGQTPEIPSESQSLPFTFEHHEPTVFTSTIPIAEGNRRSSTDTQHTSFSAMESGHSLHTQCSVPSTNSHNVLTAEPGPLLGSHADSMFSNNLQVTSANSKPVPLRDTYESRTDDIHARHFTESHVAPCTYSNSSIQAGIFTTVAENTQVVTQIDKKAVPLNDTHNEFFKSMHTAPSNDQQTCSINEQPAQPTILRNDPSNSQSGQVRPNEGLDEEEKINAVVLAKVFAKVPDMPKTLSRRLVFKFKQYANYKNVKITPDSKVIDEFVGKISYKRSSSADQKHGRSAQGTEGNVSSTISTRSGKHLPDLHAAKKLAVSAPAVQASNNSCTSLETDTSLESAPNNLSHPQVSEQQFQENISSEVPCQKSMDEEVEQCSQTASKNCASPLQNSNPLTYTLGKNESEKANAMPRSEMQASNNSSTTLEYDTSQQSKSKQSTLNNLSLPQLSKEQIQGNGTNEVLSQKSLDDDDNESEQYSPKTSQKCDSPLQNPSPLICTLNKNESQKANAVPESLLEVNLIYENAEASQTMLGNSTLSQKSVSESVSFQTNSSNAISVLTPPPSESPVKLPQVVPQKNVASLEVSSNCCAVPIQGKPKEKYRSSKTAFENRDNLQIATTTETDTTQTTSPKDISIPIMAAPEESYFHTHGRPLEKKSDKEKHLFSESMVENSSELTGSMFQPMDFLDEKSVQHEPENKLVLHLPAKKNDMPNDSETESVESAQNKSMATQIVEEASDHSRSVAEENNSVANGNKESKVLETCQLLQSELLHCNADAEHIDLCVPSEQLSNSTELVGTHFHLPQRTNKFSKSYDMDKDMVAKETGSCNEQSLKSQMMNEMSHSEPRSVEEKTCSGVSTVNITNSGQKGLCNRDRIYSQAEHGGSEYSADKDKDCIEEPLRCDKQGDSVSQTENNQVDSLGAEDSNEHDKTDVFHNQLSISQAGNTSIASFNAEDLDNSIESDRELREQEVSERQVSEMSFEMETMAPTLAHSEELNENVTDVFKDIDTVASDFVKAANGQEHFTACDQPKSVSQFGNEFFHPALVKERQFSSGEREEENYYCENLQSEPNVAKNEKAQQDPYCGKNSEISGDTAKETVQGLKSMHSSFSEQTENTSRRRRASAPNPRRKETHYRGPSPDSNSCPTFSCQISSEVQPDALEYFNNLDGPPASAKSIKFHKELSKGSEKSKTGEVLLTRDLVSSDQNQESCKKHDKEHANICGSNVLYQDRPGTSKDCFHEKPITVDKVTGRLILKVKKGSQPRHQAMGSSVMEKNSMECQPSTSSKSEDSFVRRSLRERKVVFRDEDEITEMDELLSEDDDEYDIEKDSDAYSSDSDDIWGEKSDHSQPKRMKKSQLPPDPTAFNVKIKGKYRCWLCKKTFLKCGFAKSHILRKHTGKGLCAVDLGQSEFLGSPQILLFCPKKCRYATCSLEGLKNHTPICEREVLNPLDVAEKFMDTEYEELVRMGEKILEVPERKARTPKKFQLAKKSKSSEEQKSNASEHQEDKMCVGQEAEPSKTTKINTCKKQLEAEPTRKASVLIPHAPEGHVLQASGTSTESPQSAPLKCVVQGEVHSIPAVETPKPYEKVGLDLAIDCQEPSVAPGDSSQQLQPLHSLQRQSISHQHKAVNQSHTSLSQPTPCNFQSTSSRPPQFHSATPSHSYTKSSIPPQAFSSTAHNQDPRASLNSTRASKLVQQSSFVPSQRQSSMSVHPGVRPRNPHSSVGIQQRVPFRQKAQIIHPVRTAQHQAPRVPMSSANIRPSSVRIPQQNQQYQFHQRQAQRHNTFYSNSPRQTMAPQLRPQRRNSGTLRGSSFIDQSRQQQPWNDGGNGAKAVANPRQQMQMSRNMGGSRHIGPVPEDDAYTVNESGVICLD
ncbi:Re1-silencing transcription factor [Plakobranchus ocellatus]|uniref:Re1-silencing transcription factor n=1 Tax=Plakobranchus ocellatus TaxID=259542 RepID=A0AAV4BET4_9GAST|nr:Re1-silencing transcription factor [Plakobranchus ocellatus]